VPENVFSGEITLAMLAGDDRFCVGRFPATFAGE